VAGAKKEGRVRALTLLSRSTYQIMINAFKKRYPFISDVYVQEAGATEAPQRFLLELSAGRGTDWDVFSVAPDFYNEYIPYIKKFDILGMAEQKVLAIPRGMIDPKNRISVSIASSIHVLAIIKSWSQKKECPELGKTSSSRSLKVKNSWLTSVPSDLPLWLRGWVSSGRWTMRRN
jgi:hypothetical protein